MRCCVLYIHYLIFKKKMISTANTTHSRDGETEDEMFYDLPKVTQFINGRSRTQTQAVWTQAVWLQSQLLTTL